MRVGFRGSPRNWTESQLELSKSLPLGEDMIEAALRESGGRVSGPSGAAAKLGIPGPPILEDWITKDDKIASRPWILKTSQLNSYFREVRRTVCSGNQAPMLSVKIGDL